MNPAYKPKDLVLVRHKGSLAQGDLAQINKIESGALILDNGVKFALDGSEDLHGHRYCLSPAQPGNQAIMGELDTAISHHMEMWEKYKGTRLNSEHYYARTVQRLTWIRDLYKAL